MSLMTPDDARSAAVNLLHRACEGLTRRRLARGVDDTERIAAELACALIADLADGLRDDTSAERLETALRDVLAGRMTHTDEQLAVKLQDLIDYGLATPDEHRELDVLLASMPLQGRIDGLLRRAEGEAGTDEFDAVREALRTAVDQAQSADDRLHGVTALWFLGDGERARSLFRHALAQGVSADRLLRAVQWVVERRHGVLDGFEWVMLAAGDDRLTDSEHVERLNQLRGELIAERARHPRRANRRPIRYVPMRKRRRR